MVGFVYVKGQRVGKMDVGNDVGCKMDFGGSALCSRGETKSNVSTKKTRRANEGVLVR